MSRRSLSHQDILDAIDRRCNAERERIEAERDLAKGLLTWIASGDDQASASGRSATPIAPAPVMHDKRELTAKELADIWQVSDRSVYQWRLTGGLPFKKVGRLLRFDWIEADQWAKQHREAFNKARARLRVA
ncbi:MAG TPA: helix-turn-helix domain-containing protein [Blastocatellia bacterium]|jgi:excisionase family DNA binding protein|nr:helix-turn-helix domain-containing protein [Blastocatellia bacterium]